MRATTSSSAQVLIGQHRLIAFRFPRLPRFFRPLVMLLNLTEQCIIGRQFTRHGMGIAAPQNGRPCTCSLISSDYDAALSFRCALHRTATIEGPLLRPTASLILSPDSRYRSPFAHPRQQLSNAVEHSQVLLSYSVTVTFELTQLRSDLYTMNPRAILRICRRRLEGWLARSKREGRTARWEDGEVEGELEKTEIAQ